MLNFDKETGEILVLEFQIMLVVNDTLDFLPCTVLEKEGLVTSYNYSCYIRKCNRSLFFKYCAGGEHTTNTSLSTLLPLTHLRIYDLYSRHCLPPHYGPKSTTLFKKIRVMLVAAYWDFVSKFAVKFLLTCSKLEKNISYNNRAPTTKTFWIRLLSCVLCEVGGDIDGIENHNEIYSRGSNTILYFLWEEGTYPTPPP